MFSMPGPWEWGIILVVVLLLFGGKRLPLLGSSLGQALKNFKSSLFGDGQDKEKIEDQSPDEPKK